MGPASVSPLARGTRAAGGRRVPPQHAPPPRAGGHCPLAAARATAASSPSSGQRFAVRKPHVARALARATRSAGLGLHPGHHSLRSLRWPPATLGLSLRREIATFPLPTAAAAQLLRDAGILPSARMPGPRPRGAGLGLPATPVSQSKLPGVADCPSGRGGRYQGGLRLYSGSARLPLPRSESRGSSDSRRAPGREGRSPSRRVREVLQFPYLRRGDGRRLPDPNR